MQPLVSALRLEPTDLEIELTERQALDVERQVLLLAALDLQRKGANGDRQQRLVVQTTESASNYFQAIDETV